MKKQKYYWVQAPEFGKGQRWLHGVHNTKVANWKVIVPKPPDSINLVVVLFRQREKTEKTNAILPGLAVNTLMEAEQTLGMRLRVLQRWHTLGKFARIPRTGPVEIYVDLFQLKQTHQLSWKRGFYIASRKAIKAAKENSMFTWLCLQSYMTSPLINSILFAVNGDWTRFDQRFGDVIKTHKRVQKYANPKEPYNTFNTFFKAMLLESAQVGKYLYDRSNRHKVLDEQALRTYYPEVVPFLDMQDKAAFTLAYVSALQNVIFSIPRLINGVDSFRGYAPLGIPDTLTLDVEDLRVGQQITTWGFMSVSLSAQIAADFADQSAKCCLLSVIIPSNQIAFLIQSSSSDLRFPRSLAPFHGEEEILLPAGTVVRVRKIKGERAFKTTKGKIVTLKTAKVEVVNIKKPKLPAMGSMSSLKPENPVGKMLDFFKNLF